VAQVYHFLDQQLVTEEEAKISLFDHGYLYGVGLFETFRTYEGVPFLLERHLDRLEEACHWIGLQWQRDGQKIREQIRILLGKNDLRDGYFRFNVAAGPSPLGLPTGDYEQVREALLVKPLPPPSTDKKLYTVRLRRNTPEAPLRFKSHHYLNNILAKRETPADREGVFLTADGMLAEGLVSNLFFVKEGCLYTPSLSTGILNGITRQLVLRLAEEMGLFVQEGEYLLEEAQAAEEVFVTNSIQELVPVSEWDHIVYALDRARITRRLQDRLSQTIQNSIEAGEQDGRG
jgi:4-amino-4-deoxychorismate lyase